MKNDNLDRMMKLMLFRGMGKNKNSTKKSNGSKTPFFNRGLRRIFFNPKSGFFIAIPNKNGKLQPKSVPGFFSYKNLGYRIAPWKPSR